MYALHPAVVHFPVALLLLNLLLTGWAVYKSDPFVERAASLGLARHVRFTGFLSGSDVERMYRTADVYVMPSVTEPFGIAPLEAIALDVPVIVSRNSGVAEVLRSALKVDFGNVDDLADKIIAVLTRPALRAALVAEGRRELTEMRWERRAERLIDVYKDAAA